MWRVARWLLALAVGALLWFGWPRPAHAADWSSSSETVSSSPSATPTEHALRLIDWSRSLVERLTERTSEVQTLSAELETWKSEAAALRSELESLRQDSAEVARLSRELQTALLEISRLQTESAQKQSDYSLALTAERGASQAVIDTVTRSRNTWRAVGIVGLIVAVIAGILAAAR